MRERIIIGQQPTIIEIVRIDVKAGSEADFEAGIARAAADFCEAHTKHVTGSRAWKDDRALVSEFFETLLHVEHTEPTPKPF